MMLKRIDFLNMNKIKMLSESCVLVDRMFLGQMPVFNKGQSINIDNPFTLLSNPQAIFAACNKKCISVSNPQDKMHTELRCDNILFSLDLFPPRFLVKNETTNKQSNDAKETMKQLIDYFKIYDNIGAIGMNYDFYLEASDDKENTVAELRKKILNDKLSNECSAISTTLKFDLEEENATLNMSINESARIKDISNKATIFSINIHIVVNTKDEIEKAFKSSEQHLQYTTNKIESILSL